MENNHVITEKANKKLSWKQVTIGGISGVVLGAVSTAAYAGTEKPEEVEEELGSTPVAGVDGQAHVDTVIPVAEVDNALPFAQAFASARHQVGAGGVFVWHGKVFNTYTAEEWESMSDAEHAGFGSHLSISYNDGNPPKVQSDDVHESNSLQEDSDIEVLYNPEEDSDSDIEVLSYGTIDHGDDGQWDYAVLSVNGHEYGIIDVDNDNIADLMAQDINQDGQITPDEVKDISDMNISMQAIHEDYLAQNDSSAQGPDYVNDGNIDNYMA